MTRFVRKGRLGGLTRSELERLPSVVARRDISLAFLSREQGIRPEALMAFLLCLEADGHTNLYIALYHHCSESPVQYFLFRDYTDPPTVCPDCENKIRPRDLAVDFKCRLSRRLRIDG